MPQKSNARNVAHIRDTGHFFRFVFAEKFLSRSKRAKSLGNGAPDRTRTCDPRLRRANSSPLSAAGSMSCAKRHADAPRAVPLGRLRRTAVRYNDFRCPNHVSISFASQPTARVDRRRGRGKLSSLTIRQIAERLNPTRMMTAERRRNAARGCRRGDSGATTGRLDNSSSITSIRPCSCPSFNVSAWILP